MINRIIKAGQKLHYLWLRNIWNYHSNFNGRIFCQSIKKTKHNYCWQTLTCKQNQNVIFTNSIFRVRVSYCMRDKGGTQSESVGSSRPHPVSLIQKEASILNDLWHTFLKNSLINLCILILLLNLSEGFATNWNVDHWIFINRGLNAECDGCAVNGLTNINKMQATLKKRIKVKSSFHWLHAILWI